MSSRRDLNGYQQIDARSGDPARISFTLGHPVHTAVRGRALHGCKSVPLPTGEKLLETGLSAHQAIKSVDANPLTGNVLVTFDTPYDLNQVAAIITHVTTADSPENDIAPPSGSAVASKKDSWKARLAENLHTLGDHVRKKEQKHLPWHTMDSDQVLARTGFFTYDRFDGGSNHGAAPGLWPEYAA